MKFPLIFSTLSAAALLASGCAPATHLGSVASQPRIAIYGGNWKSLSVAITEYNLSKGRKLDLATSNKLLLYDATPAANGVEQVTSKAVYDYTFFPDSVIIASHRYQTSDLDDSTSTEADDSATYIAEQQELREIA